MIESEIWRVAANAVRQHGDRAATVARERIAAAVDADAPTLRVWVMIVAAIDEILRDRRSAGERLN
jgi:hypothetical protein